MKRTMFVLAGLLFACGGEAPSGSAPTAPAVESWVEGVRCESGDCAPRWLVDARVWPHAFVVGSFVYYTEDGRNADRVPVEGGWPSPGLDEVNDFTARGPWLFSTVWENGTSYLNQMDGATQEVFPIDAACREVEATDDAAYCLDRDALTRLPRDGGAPVALDPVDGLNLRASESFVCWRWQGDEARCRPTAGGATVRIGGVDVIGVIAGDALYFLDAAGRLRRAALPSGEVTLVYDGACELGMNGDSTHLYFGARSDGELRVQRLELASGAIERFATARSGDVVGGDDTYLLLGDPLRILTK
ncbi:MAG: hypothetical protein RIT81_31040 [Deltaproteobacteria bacterium]